MKSHWTLIDFQWTKDKWQYKNSMQSPATLTMQDVSSKQEILTQLEPWEAEHVLGIRLVADGNMKSELEYCIQQSQIWAIRSCK